MRAFAKRPDNNLDALMIDITRKLLKITLAVVTVFFIGQSIFQLNITTLLAGAGVAGLAVAFASRETLSNFFGTLVIILDRPFRIGDRVQIGEVDGIVQTVGMRSTRILTANESLFSIPNSRIAEVPVENISNCGVIRYSFVLGLVYGTTADQMEQAMQLLHGIADNFKGQDAPAYKPRIFFEALGSSALNIRIIMWLKTTSYVVEEQLRTEVNLAIVRKFTEARALARLHHGDQQPDRFDSAASAAGTVRGGRSREAGLTGLRGALLQFLRAHGIRSGSTSAGFHVPAFSFSPRFSPLFRRFLRRNILNENCAQLLRKLRIFGIISVKCNREN